MATETQTGPATFEELLTESEQTGRKPCTRCGQPATHRVAITVRRPTAARPKGQRGGAVRGEQIATHRGSLCEACAVQVFATFRKAVR